MKKVILFVCVFLIPLAPRAAVGAPPLPPEVLDSVVLISGHGSCATAFILESGEIVTNAHVVQAVCPHGNCAGVVVKRSRGLDLPADVPVATEKIAPLLTLPAHDCALLRSEAQPLPGVFKSGAPAAEGAKTLTLGFPGCGRLKLSEGKVLRSNRLQIVTSNRASYGSSGSPLFDDQWRVLGIGGRAASLLQTLSAPVFARQFFLKSIPFRLLTEARSLSGEALFTYQLRALHEFHGQEVLSKRGAERLNSALDFVVAVQGLLDELPLADLDPAAFRPLLQPERALTLLPALPPAGHSSAELVAIEYAVETRGLLDRSFRPVDIALLLQRLAESGRPPDEIEAARLILEKTRQQKYRGLYLASAARLARLIVAALVLVILWGWSLGYVYAAAAGPRPRRLLAMLAVAVLAWPLSLMYFELRRRGRGRAAITKPDLTSQA